ncbi:MAG: efflux RND transporter periplasmic adaptor subunit [Deltaproteobacteria bacterium]|nr:efflux RND transporter periplasmic adaptor subunit [Deltaproteobacteria bacterium]
MKAKGRLFWVCLLVLSAVALGYFMYDMLPKEAAETKTNSRAMSLPLQEKPDYRRLVPRKARTADMVFIGKTVCSLRHSVALPVQGAITSLNVQAGQSVLKGDALAAYRPAPESRYQGLGAPDIKALELLLNGLNRQLTDLKNRVREPGERRNLPTSAVKQLDDTEKQLRILTDQVKLLVKRLDYEGSRDAPEPAETAITSPIDGHVLWVHPEIRPGVRWTAEDPIFVVGVMDPMLVRSHVYEEEALRLALEDRVTLQPESLNPKRLEARISRISWTPLSMDPVQPSYYEVEFTAANPNLMLREGMRVIIHLHKPLNPPSPGADEEETAKPPASS